MKKYFILLSCFSLFVISFSSFATDEPPKVDVPNHLQNCSVMVVTKDGSGSGVIVNRNGVSYVWTAGHVIEDLRKERKSGDKKIVEFDDAEIAKHVIQHGRTVAKLTAYAEVIRYSGVTHGHDLALLKVRMKSFPSESTKFYLDDNIPNIDTDLYHCGSLLGEIGANSVTRGNLSAVGRLIDGKVFDQSDCRTLPGSSGGGIFLRDGRCIGLLLRGASSTFSLHIPVRRIVEYARSTGVEFTLNPVITTPTEKELNKHPIEDN